jgi:hypothetical protein
MKSPKGAIGSTASPISALGVESLSGFKDGAELRLLRGMQEEPGGAPHDGVLHFGPTVQNARNSSSTVPRPD